MCKRVQLGSTSYRVFVAVSFSFASIVAQGTVSKRIRDGRVCIRHAQGYMTGLLDSMFGERVVNQSTVKQVHLDDKIFGSARAIRCGCVAESFVARRGLTDSLNAPSVVQLIQYFYSVELKIDGEYVEKSEWYYYRRRDIRPEGILLTSASSR